MKDNELIAGFMGLKCRNINLDDHPRYDPVKVWYKDDPAKWFSFPEYETSWDSLMPVVEKIEDMHHVVTIYPLHCDIRLPSGHPNIEEGKCDTKIQAVYQAAVEFIKWYNSQKS